MTAFLAPPKCYVNLLLLAVLVIESSGCAFNSEKISRPWSGAFVYETSHYTVKTDTSLKTARHIGELMGNAFDAYGQLIGYPQGYLPKFLVNAYATRNEYEAIAQREGFSKGVTAGFYTPEAPVAINLAYVLGRRRNPDATLLHEGLHQFLDYAMNFAACPSIQSLIPSSEYRLLSVPLWLNEGLAAYMENAVPADNKLAIGRINQGRLLHLQALIRRGRCPSLRQVLSKPYGEPISEDDYAVFWGIVYVLCQEPGQKHLRRYLEACKKAFYENPKAEFSRDFIAGGRLPGDFKKQWAGYIARHSLLYFERTIVGEDSTLEIWEQDWIKRINRLK